jgi:hypothetical protein
MSRKKLNEDDKPFIVMWLACFKSPSEVAALVKEEFGVTMSRQAVEVYDPTKRAGRSLSEELKKLFEETRAAYIADVQAVPLAHQRYRLDVLQRLLDRELLKDAPNKGLVLDIQERGAKESGGAYTNRREHTGRDGGPIEAVAMTIDQWREKAAERRAQAAQTSSDFEG